MMFGQFTLDDLAGTLESVLLFPIILLAPGYVVGWAFEILAFRGRLVSTRLAIALPLSIGICPIIAYYLSHFLPAALWLFYGACAVAFVALLFYDGRRWWSDMALRAFFSRECLGLAVVIIWVLLAGFVLIDLQIGDRLYFPTVTYDYALRSAFTASISRTGVPPHNPYFFPEHAFNLRYHYFWLILCSIVQRMSLTGVSPRQAMLGGTVWCGLGLLVLVPLYLRFFQIKGKAEIKRRAFIGIALLGVTGLDILPVLFIERTAHNLLSTMDWWNKDQVTSWIAAVLWVPNHVAGLIACLTGFLVIWNVSSSVGTRKKVLLSVVAGSMFASALGLTIYVTFGFGIFLTGWMLIAFIRNRRGPAGLILLSGITALVISLPFLSELFGRESGTLIADAGSRTFPVQFGIRRFSVFDLLMGFTNSGQWKQTIADLVILPVNYFFELGFFMIVGAIQCKRLWYNRKHLSDVELCTFTMTITAIAICTFMRSAVIAGNDLGLRAFMLAQFVLLIWGADLLADCVLFVQPSKYFGGYLTVLIVMSILLGVGGTAYELFKIRFYPIQSDLTGTPLNPWLSPDRNLGARTFALRKLYEELKQRTPASAVFQHNPKALPQDNFHGMYADRQLAAETPSCAVVFGGDASLCQSRIPMINRLFEDGNALSATDIDGACKALSINVLVVKDTDDIWKDGESWIWKRKPLVANNYARAFRCGADLPARRSP